MNFKDYQLHPNLQKAIESQGFETPTEIQQKALPIILKGKDLAGLAQTGTGKTAAFLLPLLERILATQALAQNQSSETSKDDQEKVGKGSGVVPFDSWKPGHFVLVLVPTRELAEQVQQNCQSLGSASGIKSAVIYGGSSYDKQKEALKKDPEFIIATPGRLIDLFKEHFIDLKQVKAVVFDEADRMFDMGFKDDMKYILRRLPDDRQFLVFSATLNFEVLHAAYEFGAQPIEVNVSKDKATAEHVKDSIFHVGSQEKPKYLISLLTLHKPKQAIIFSNYKRDVERLALFLSRNDFPAAAISSLLSQAQRNRVMAQFKSESSTNILVATDVAARGLDIAGVDLVINYDLPDDPENYVHRIGRTGRAGKEGQAFSLVTEKDVDALPRIEDYVHRKLEIGWMENDDLIDQFKPLPREGFSGPSKSRSAGASSASRSTNKRSQRPQLKKSGNDRREKEGVHSRSLEQSRADASQSKSAKRRHSRKNSKIGQVNGELKSSRRPRSQQIQKRQSGGVAQSAGQSISLGDKIKGFFTRWVRGGDQK